MADDRPPNERLRTVELFCGIGGFRLAADCHHLDTVWANDLCVDACRVYADRLGPAGLHPGALSDVAATVPDHELLTAGFPCQPFSSAGKKRGVRDTRGTLFQQIVELLDQHRPRWFLLENVRRLLSMEEGEHFRTVLRALARLPYRVEWRLVHVCDLGLPQNRARVLILGTREPASLGGVPTVAEAVLASAEELDPWAVPRTLRLDRPRGPFPRWGMVRGEDALLGEPSALAERRPAPPLARVLEANVEPRFDFTESTRTRMQASVWVDRLVEGVRVLCNQDGGARMGYTVYGTDGLAPTLTATTSRHYERYRVGDRYRRLTPVEYARLQGFPDDHCSTVPLARRYALLGNAAPPPLVGWALERLLRREAFNGF